MAIYIRGTSKEVLREECGYQPLRISEVVYAVGGTNVFT
jgi:hypothetical protein